MAKGRKKQQHKSSIENFKRPPTIHGKKEHVDDSPNKTNTFTNSGVDKEEGDHHSRVPQVSSNKDVDIQSSSQSKIYTHDNLSKTSVTLESKPDNQPGKSKANNTKIIQNDKKPSTSTTNIITKPIHPVASMTNDPSEELRNKKGKSRENIEKKAKDTNDTADDKPQTSLIPTIPSVDANKNENKAILTTTIPRAITPIATQGQSSDYCRCTII